MKIRGPVSDFWTFTDQEIGGHCNRRTVNHFFGVYKMNQRQLLSSALASVMALGLVSQASADMGAEKGKEKCFGIAKAGENSCANLSGSHSCAGQASVNKSPDEWKLVAKGTCAKLGGLSAEEAKVALAKQADKK
ncbi:hypothetical protein AQB9606_00829 [Aquabacterium sp. CECT 9606]|nr:hypothetical protein AQB9606_00829 [Aquabacterium sp. CECT 9606]